jgi:hypothetical protein
MEEYMRQVRIFVVALFSVALVVSMVGYCSGQENQDNP